MEEEEEEEEEGLFLTFRRDFELARPQSNTSDALCATLRLSGVDLRDPFRIGCGVFQIENWVIRIEFRVVRIECEDSMYETNKAV